MVYAESMIPDSASHSVKKRIHVISLEPISQKPTANIKIKF